MSAKLSPYPEKPSETDALSVVAYRVRTYRINMGWSLEELGAESGLDRTYVSGIENKRWNVSLKNLEKIAAALGTPTWKLLLPPGDEEVAPRR